MAVGSPGPVPEDALAYFRAKDLRVGFDHRDVWLEEHAHAFTVAKAMQLDLLEDMRGAVDAAIAEGKTFEQFRQELEPTLRSKGWWGRRDVTDPATGEVTEAQLGSPRRLRTIYSANMRSARAAGQWARIQRTKETKPYLLYLLGPSENHRQQHVAWAGTMLPVDDSWWDDHYPPNGWGCKCHVRQVSEQEAQRLEGEGVQDPDAPQETDDDGRPTGRRQDRRIPVKREAPERSPRQFVNERTGETRTVDAGLDPAWASNPGKDRAATLRGDLTGAVARADDANAHAAAGDVMGSAILSQWRKSPDGELPAGVVGSQAREQLGGRSQVVRLTPDSDLPDDATVEDLAVLPELLFRGLLVRTDGGLAAFRQAGEQWYRADVVAGDDRLDLARFRAVDAAEVEAAREGGEILRE